MLRKVLDTPNEISLTVLRIVLGIVFFAHGAQKVLGWFGGYGFDATMSAFTGMGIPAPFAFLAIVAEFFGGLGLILGLLGRIAAFGVFSVMVVASQMHVANGFFMNWNGQQAGEGYEFHLLALAMSAVLILRGAGSLSIDRLIAQRAEHQSRAGLQEWKNARATT